MPDQDSNLDPPKTPAFLPEENASDPRTRKQVPPLSAFQGDFLRNLPALLVVFTALMGIGMLKDLPRSGEGYTPIQQKPAQKESPIEASPQDMEFSPAIRPFVNVLILALLGGALYLLFLCFKWIKSSEGRSEIDLSRSRLGPGPETRMVDVAVILALNIFLAPLALWLLIRLSPKNWWYWDAKAQWWTSVGGPGTLMNLSAQFVSYAAIIVAVVWIVRYRDRLKGVAGLWPFWENPCLTPSRNVKSDLVTGALFYLLFAIPLILSMQLNLKLLDLFGKSPDVNMLVPTIAQETRWWTVAGLGVLIVLGAAVAEEFIFRGVLYTALRRYLGKWGGAIISAMLFSAIHMVWANVIPLFLLGLLLAWLYERTGRLTAPMALHALNNAVTLFLVKASVGG